MKGHTLSHTIRLRLKSHTISHTPDQTALECRTISHTIRLRPHTFLSPASTAMAPSGSASVGDKCETKTCVFDGHSAPFRPPWTLSSSFHCAPPAYHPRSPSPPLTNIHDDDVTLLDLPCKDALCKAVLNQAHDGTAQGAGPVAGVEPVLDQPAGGKETGVRRRGRVKRGHQDRSRRPFWLVSSTALPSTCPLPCSTPGIELAFIDVPSPLFCPSPSPSPVHTCP